MTNKQKSIEVKKTVRNKIKRINTYLKAGLTWKAIRYALGLNCNEKTLAYHYYNRGII